MLNTGKRHYIIRIYESIENNRNVRDSKRPEQKGNKIKINSISQLLPTIYQESQTHCRHEIRFQNRGFGRESRVPVGYLRRHLHGIPRKVEIAWLAEAGYGKPATFSSAIGRTPVTFH